MKRLSFLLPILVILMAIGGAFAMKNSNEVAMVQVWYYLDEENPDPTECTQADVTLCAPGSFDCQRAIPALGGQQRTIHQDNQCESPYTSNLAN